MNVVATVLEIVAPVFLLAALGFLWVRLGNEYRVAFVTRLAMTVSIPCLIFTALMKTEIDTSSLAATLWACCIVYGLLTVMFLAIIRFAGLEVRTYLAPLVFGNTGNLGLPLAYFAFGQEGLGFAVIVFAFMGVYSFTFGVWIVSGGGSVLNVVREPLVPATLLGALFLVAGWETPVWLTNTLELIGQMAIPLMLITLGVALSRLQLSGLGRAVWLAAFKSAACIAVAVAAATMLELEPVPFAVLVLQVAMPVAVTSYLLAEKYGANAEEVAGLVIVSTLLSVVTIPVMLAFLVTH